MQPLAGMPGLTHAHPPAQAKIKEMTHSNVLHPGLTCFSGQPHRVGGIRTPVPVDEVPGIKEAGWCACVCVRAGPLPAPLR
jgi:hypothetical protein